MNLIRNEDQFMKMINVQCSIFNVQVREKENDEFQKMLNFQS